jgi:AbrB family looped-hinge helix DNA binding protein
MGNLTTTVSTKGQVILPKALRDARKWRPGTKLVVEETPDGILLRAAPVFPATSLDDVVGMLKYDGPPVSLEDMNAAIEAEAIRRAKLGRY